MTIVQQRAATDSILALSSFDPPDYVDVFSVTIAPEMRRLPDQWARAGVERGAGRAGQFVWRRLLGLRLVPGAEHIGGWKVGARGEDWIRLEASSWFLSAQIVMKIDGGELFVATLIRYDRPLARMVWIPLSIGHRAAMPRLLRRAGRGRALRSVDRISHEEVLP